MASEINVSELNTNYPITGINNDTKGFRDNFTIIKNNLIISGREITELQNSAVLIVRNDEPVNNDLLGSTLENGQLSNMVGVVYAPAAPVSGTLGIDFTHGPLQLFTLSGNITSLSFIGWPTISAYAHVRVHFTCTGYNRTISIPALVLPKKIIYENSTPSMVVEKDTHLMLDVWTFDGGNTIFIQSHAMTSLVPDTVGLPSLHLSDSTEPTRDTTTASFTTDGGGCITGRVRILSTANPTVPTANAALMVDGGAVIGGRLFVNTSITVNGSVIRPSYTGYETITSGTVNVTVYTATLFAHTGSSSASLAAGSYDGQIKVLVNTVSHSITVSVVNPGWVSAATAVITFTNPGDTCTLQYLNGSWQCIGSNGITI